MKTCEQGPLWPPAFYNHIDPAKAVRSFEDHSVVLWCNLPTAGVLGAAKQDFILTAVTNMLTTYKRNGVAIFVDANRAGDPARTDSVNDFPTRVNECPA